MREIALYDAKNRLSALVAEVEASGEPVVITRHGMAAVQLVPCVENANAKTRKEALERIASNRDAWAKKHPESAAPLPWETLKAWMDDERL